MFGNILNGIPGVGHAKAIIHYVGGNRYEGDKAFYAANRTTAVMAGGAAGIVGGPAGVIAGATGAGLLVDTVASVASNRPMGVLQGIDDIATDIGNGDVPVGSVLKTGLYIGADALSGFGGGAITSSITKSAGKSVAKDVAVIVAKNIPAGRMVVAGSIGHKLAEDAPRSHPRSRGSKSGSTGSTTQSKSQPKQSNPSSSGSGSQPPKDHNNKKDHEKEQGESHLSAFLRIFNVASLEDVIIRGVYIFQKLSSGQVKTLKKLIKQLRMNGYLTRVVETVINLFNKMEVGDVTFQNFLSLAQFVASYIGEQVAQRGEAQRGTSERPRPYEERREENCSETIRDIIRPGSRNNILAIFRQLYSQIQGKTCVPNFRNIFSAIYHYFKHRINPQTGDVISVADYFNLIQFLLRRVRTLTEYSQLTDVNHPRRELVFDRVFAIFGRRVRIVLKIQDNILELSSCYVYDKVFEGEEDGDEFIDPDK